MGHHIPTFIEATIQTCRNQANPYGGRQQGYRALGWQIHQHFDRWVDGIGPNHGGSVERQQRAEQEFEALQWVSRYGCPPADLTPHLAWFRKFLRDILALVPARRHIRVVEGFIEACDESEPPVWEYEG